MKRITAWFVFVALFAQAVSSAVADEMSPLAPMDGRVTVQEYQGIGKINSVNVKTGKVNITYEPISSLGWKGMTKDFVVQDKAILTNVKKGQKVIFKMVEVSKGKYVVNEIIEDK